jgi:hypothetical protein
MNKLPIIGRNFFLKSSVFFRHIILDKRYLKWYYILVLLLAGQNLFSQDQIDKLFDKYEGKDGFTTVYVSPYMFNMFRSMNSNDKDFDSLVKGLKSIRILSVENPKLVPPGTDFYKEILNELPMTNYKELMFIKNKDQQVKFLLKIVSGRIVQLLLISGGTENALICIDGDIDMNHLAELSKSMNIQEMKPLQNLKPDK